MSRATIILAVAMGCSADDPDLTESNDPVGESMPADDGGFGPPACNQPMTSTCGNEAAIIQGRVRLAEGIETTTGDLFIALVHEAYSGAQGGGYHTHMVLPDVDLSEPVDFAFDMCEGGEMWSEENCTYSLQVILDQNRDQTPANLVAAAGEPAARVTEIHLSCDADAPCLDVVLDCTDGPACNTFTELPSCACEQPTCNSPITLCG